MKKIFSIMLVLLLIISLSACDSGDKDITEKKNDVIGEWYNKDGKCLDIRSDGSWKLEDSYGTGTWKALDGGLYEFTDFYGDTQESGINENELGTYIDFGYYGDFYRNSYPTIDQLDTIDAFENVSITTKGASPFCLVEVDTSNCSDLLKNNYSYTVDKNYHKSGEKITIYATLNGEAGGTTKLEKEFLLDDVPSYISALTESQKEQLTNELSEYIESQLNVYESTGEFCGSTTMETYSAKVLDIKTVEIGFFRLKDDCFDKYGSWAYNCFYGIYAIDALNQNNNKEYTYLVEVMFPSIAETDGNLMWYIHSQNEDEFNKIQSHFYGSVSDFSRASTFRSYYKSEYYESTIFETNDVEFK